jgi:hypothetical protein
MIILGIIGLIYFIKIWPSHLPSFLQNSNISWLMQASGIIFAIILLFAIVVLFRESKEYILLTDKNIILNQGKKPNPTRIPLNTIKEFSLGSSPLEILSRCNSLWIILKGDPEKSHLVGPLTQEEAIILKKLLEEKLKTI